MQKRGTKPTKKQKIFIAKFNLNADNWLIVKDNNKEFVIKHRLSGKIRVLKRG